MDEEKPEHAQPEDPAEESQHADNSLVSKLARAYSSLPSEQRAASALPGSSDPVSNPELDDRFQKLLKQVEVLETYQGHRGQRPDPRVVALLEKKIQALRVQGDQLPDDGASAKAAPAEEVGSLIRGSVRCSKCGQSNSASSRFCGMCGAELLKSLGASDNGSASTANAAAPRREPETPMFSVEPGTQGRSRRGFRIGLLALLLAVLVLLVSQQWPWWQQPFLRTWIVRASNALPAPSAAVTTAPVPAKHPANPAVSVRAPQPLPATPKPSKAVPSTPPKPAPPTTIKRPLPGPAPLTSTLPQLEVPSSTQHEPVSTPASVVQLGHQAPAAPEASEPPQRTRLPSAVAQGGLILKVDPEYPVVARMARVQGSVVLHAIIGKDGTVQQLQVVSGNPLLAGSALNAVKNWRYRPYLVDGQAVEVETTVNVNFKGED